MSEESSILVEQCVAPPITLKANRRSMIRVSLLYPLNEGQRFDLDYYCSQHLPLMRRRLGTACLNLSMERGLAGLSALVREDDDFPELMGKPVTITHLYFDSEESFHRAMAPCAEEILADQANCTDITPTVCIEEVQN